MGTFYSSAIFSQNDPKTSVDFRNYNKDKPNRTPPYISKRKGDKDYKSLEKIGVISNKTGFSIDLKKVKKINTDIWMNI